MPLVDTLNLNPALQAGRILEAFSSGNQPLLHQELQRSRRLAHGAAPGLEEERLELLLALSEGLSDGMLRAGDLFSESRPDPAVRRCLDLLAHLAKAPSFQPDTKRFSSSLHN
jgi:hypothetical protein